MRHPLAGRSDRCHTLIRDSVRSGRDRWLLSYADLVTLLFACFTTAYAAAHVTAEGTPRVETPTPVLAAAEVVAPAEPSIRDLVAPIVLAAVGSSHVELVEDQRGLVITLPESATFPIASAALTDDARSFLMTLGEALRTTTAALRVEGHTDNVPLGGGRYATNWELSTARASAVVLFLIDQAGFDPARLSAAGYGEFHPRVANDTPEQRALNRRVDVVVIHSTQGDQP